MTDTSSTNPVLDNFATDASFAENGGPAALSPALTISDITSATLTGATVSIAAPGAAGVSSVSVSDYVGTVQNLTVGQIAQLQAAGVRSISAYSGSVSFNSAQALALENAGISVSVQLGSAVYLQESFANYSSLTVGQIAGLKNVGITFLSGSDSSNGNANPLSVLELNTAQAIAFKNSGIIVDPGPGRKVLVSDSAANILALPANQIAALQAANYALKVSDTVANVQALSPTQLATLQGAGIGTTANLYLYNGSYLYETFEVSDTAANILALTQSQIASLRSEGVQAFAVADTAANILALSSAQLSTLSQDGVTGIYQGGYTYHPFRVVDTAANIEGLSPGQLTSLLNDGIREFDVTDASLVLNVAQAAALASAGINYLQQIQVPSGDTVTVTATAAQIQSLTVSQIQSLRNNFGLSTLSASDTSVVLSVAETIALANSGLKVTAPTGSTVTISDTATNIAALTTSQINNLFYTVGVTAISVTDAAMVFNVNQAVTLESVNLTVSAPSHSTISDTANNIRSLAPTQIAALPATGIYGITVTDASLALTAAQAAAVAQAGLPVTVPAGDSISVADNAYNMLNLSPSQVSTLRAAGFNSFTVVDNAYGILNLSPSQVSALNAAGFNAIYVADTANTILALTPSQLTTLQADGVTSTRIVDNTNALLALNPSQIVALGTAGLQDVLTAATDGTNITAKYDASTETLTLFGSDTLAHYQQVLRSITFNNTGENPTGYGFTPIRTITWTVSDGTDPSDTSVPQTTTVHITGVNNPPVLGNVATAASFTEVGPAAVLSSSLTITDPDNLDLARATVTITAGAFAGDGDLLSANTIGTNIIASFNSSTEQLTLSGSDTLANYQAVLRTVSFSTSSQNPTNYGSNPSRTLTWQLDDSSATNNLSTPQTTSVDITATNSRPVLSNVAATSTFTPGGSAVTLSNNAVVSDPDNLDLAGASVTISGGTFDGDGDTLSADTTGTNITASFDSTTERLTLSGSDTLSNYAKVLNTVTFATSASDPTDGGNHPTRTIAWVLDDGASANHLSNPIITTVNLAPGAPSGLADASIVAGYVNAANNTAAQKLTGSAEAGSTVTVFDNLNNLGTTTAAFDGSWSFTLGQLADGSHSLTATATDAVGNTGAASAALAFIVDTQAPAASLTLNPITADNVLNATEATGTVAVTGSVSGDVHTGDTVSLTVNGHLYNGTVNGTTFSIDVPGSALAFDVDHTVDASVATSDIAGNIAIATSTKVYTVATTPTTVSLFGASSTPAATYSDGTPLEVGVKFTSSVAGQITALKFYRSASDTGPDVVDLWSATGANLASVTFTNTAASGWQTVTLATPVDIAANTTYIASYHTTGTYVATTNFFASPLSSGPLTTTGGNGVYSYGGNSTTGVFPTNTYNSANYWADVVFSNSAGTGGADNAPVLAVQTGNQNAVVNSAFSLTLPSGTFTDVDAGDILTYSATKADGSALPAWLTFDPASRSFSGTPTAADVGTLSIQASATDLGNLTASETFNISVTTTTTPTVSLFGASSTPAATYSDGTPLEVGVKFTSSVAGQITALKFYRSASDTGPDVVDLWSATGANLASVTFTNTTASGWQTVTLATPVDIAANTTYIASYHTTGTYVATTNFFASPLSSGPLTTTGGNGVYSYGGNSTTGVFPTNTYNSANYWADVVFSNSAGTGGADNAPVLAVQTGNQNAVVNSAFSLTLPSGTFTDVDAGDILTYSATKADGSALPAWLTFDPASRSFSGTPTAADVGTLSIQASATDLGNLTASETFNISVTTTTTPTVSLFGASSTPAATYSDGTPLEVGVKFTSSVAGQITALKFYRSASDTGPDVVDLWSATGANLASVTFTNTTASGWQTVTLATPVDIAANTTYIASYHTTGTYAATANFFTSPISSGPLTAPSSDATGGNGVYAYGGSDTTGIFPTSSFHAANYGADVVFRQLA